MKFKSGRFLQSREGETRKRIIFAWWPLETEDGHWLWLQKVRITEEIKEVDIGGRNCWGHYAFKWIIIEVNEL